jgi:transcriptional regulator of acetoin/glycerol metabolism
VNHLRPEIALSWKRSQLNGLDPGHLPEPTLLGPSDTAGRLLHAARPVLDELGAQLAGTECCILLVDRDCRIVTRVFDSAPMQRAMDDLGVLPGAELSEETFGTNALGTPLEVRQGLVVHGEEHFLEPLKEFSCYGHPLVHPVTRRIEGILDITAVGKTANPLFAPVVARAARDIETRLLEDAREADQRVVEAFQRAAQQRGLAVAAMGEDIMLTNKSAVELLVPADHAALRAIAMDLPSGQSRTMDFALASGGRTTLRIDRIPGIDSGALFLLDATGDRKPVRRTVAAQTTSSSLRTELARMRAGTGSVAVLGEPGSGRTWAAREFTGSEGPFLDAARIVAEGEREWSARLLSVVDAATETDVIVVEHLDMAPDSVLALLASLLESGPRFVFTSDPPDRVREPVREFLTRCSCRVRIPALRYRIREIGDLASSLADELGRPDIRLGPGAVAALAERSWPGNLVELRAVLAGIPERESSLPIRAEDLASEYRGTARVAKLGGLERAEREAIIDALRDSGGNKVHAAAALGISRTTLYSRIKALGIA